MSSEDQLANHAIRSVANAYHQGGQLSVAVVRSKRKFPFNTCLHVRIAEYGFIKMVQRNRLEKIANLVNNKRHLILSMNLLTCPNSWRIVTHRYISPADEGPSMYAPASNQNAWPEVDRCRAAGENF
ncbi:hypothetical protein EVAR_13802_1 [Eumeta japonica]|uniref:Uncharacterized protein n=1 Tax=Eumeta variegata TaxID=151549 RepID=A0A4C1U2H6_EUMVA|nr:hypothetical protein EVAR_13802_1 [Eumeta japonica]